MGKIGKDFKFKIIKNFLNKEEIKLLSIYFEIKHRTNIENFDYGSTNLGDTGYYGDPIIDSLMLSKQKLIEKEIDKKLLATYSFWRCYTKFATLAKHKDREACEISVSVSVSGDKEWPIFMDDQSIVLKPGDAVVYLGCEIEHKREEYLGDHQFQAFLHYVDKDGNFKDEYMDKRNFWGIVKCR